MLKPHLWFSNGAYRTIPGQAWWHVPVIIVETGGLSEPKDLKASL